MFAYMSFSLEYIEQSDASYLEGHTYAAACKNVYLEAMRASRIPINKTTYIQFCIVYIC